MHSKAIVTKPQNVFIMRDVLLNGYIGGCNTTMFPKVPAEFNQALNNRLSLEENYMFDTKGVHSIIPIPVPWDWHCQDESRRRRRPLPFPFTRVAPVARRASDRAAPALGPQVIGLSDRILPWTVSRDASAQYSTFPGGRAAFKAFYDLGFDLTAVRKRRTSQNAFLSKTQQY
jgi:hypothetical protein